MLPTEVTPAEVRQFDLLVRRNGAQPAAFEVRKFRFRSGSGYKVRVVGRGGATVYETRDPNSWIGQFANDLENGLFGNLEEAVPATLVAPLAEVERAMAQRGLQGALEVLNARVPHRFTAVYRLAGQSLHNVATVDKHKHLDPLDLKVVPLQDSFCQFVLRDGIFLTQASGTDARLAGHPYGGIVQCYAGVRIFTREGRMAGTLCHFDLESHDVDDEEYLLLDRTARLMPAFLQN